MSQGHGLDAQRGARARRGVGRGAGYPHGDERKADRRRTRRRQQAPAGHHREEAS